MTTSATQIKGRAGGLVIALTGAAVAIGGGRAHVGTLAAMGAGFMPLVLGVLLAIAGLSMIAFPGGGGGEHGEAARPDARGVLCVFAGVVSFALLGDLAGLVPASLTSVFIAALGDRKNSWRDALVMAVAATAFGAAVFSFALHLQLPLFRMS